MSLASSYIAILRQYIFCTTSAEKLSCKILYSKDLSRINGIVKFKNSVSLTIKRLVNRMVNL